MNAMPAIVGRAEGQMGNGLSLAAALKNCGGRPKFHSKLFVLGLQSLLPIACFDSFEEVSKGFTVIIDRNVLNFFSGLHFKAHLIGQQTVLLDI